jgi:hypothetical protein
MFEAFQVAQGTPNVYWTVVDDEFVPVRPRPNRRPACRQALRALPVRAACGDGGSGRRWDGGDGRPGARARRMGQPVVVRRCRAVWRVGS